MLKINTGAAVLGLGYIVGLKYAAIICAGLAKVNPIEVSKRNALPCIASAIVLMLLL